MDARQVTGLIQWKKPSYCAANLWGLITTKSTFLIPISHLTFPLHSHFTDGADLPTITTSYNSQMLRSLQRPHFYSIVHSFACSFFFIFLTCNCSPESCVSVSLFLFPQDSLLFRASLCLSEPLLFWTCGLSLLIIALLQHSGTESRVFAFLPVVPAT